MEDKKEEKVEKEKIDKKENKHGLLYWIIVIVTVSAIMIMSVNIGQILITEHRKNKQEEEKDTKTVENYNYSNFLKDGKYLNDTSDWENKPYAYYLYDIDKDGVDELFVVSYEGKDTEFFNTAIYTYKNSEVKLVANLYTYKYVYGYTEGEGVVYATQKTSSINYYVLYKMVDGKLETVPDVSFETGDDRIIVKEPVKLP